MVSYSQTERFVAASIVGNLGEGTVHFFERLGYTAVSCILHDGL